MGQQDFTTPGSGSYTVSAGVKSINLYLIGGGGGGSSGTQGDGAGGGAYLDVAIAVVAGTTYSFVVGAGGAVDGDGADTTWDSGSYVAGGGISGATTGAGGTVSGGTPDHSSHGGAGAAGGQCCGDTCLDCTCDDPPDCNSYSCASTSNDCGDYRGGGGSAGSSGGFNNGFSPSCGGGGGTCGSTNYPGNSGSDGAGGGAPALPGGDGGNGGANGHTYGGGGGGNGTGASGLLTVAWIDGSCAFSTQPSSAQVNHTISPFSVTVKCSDGSTDTNYQGPVGIGFWSNPGGGTLNGTLTVNAVNGVATFSDISIDRVANTYQLIASVSDAYVAYSDFSGGFDITAAPLQYFAYLDKLAARLGNLIPKISR